MGPTHIEQTEDAAAALLRAPSLFWSPCCVSTLVQKRKKDPHRIAVTHGLHQTVSNCVIIPSTVQARRTVLFYVTYFCFKPSTNAPPPARTQISHFSFCCVIRDLLDFSKTGASVTGEQMMCANIYYFSTS